MELTPEVLTQLKDAFKGVVDDAFEEKLKGVVGPMIASETRSIVESMRAQTAIFGRDISGVSQEKKEEFAKFVKAVVYGQKANEAIISEQDNRGGYLVPMEVAAGIQRIAATVGIVLSQATRWPMKSDELSIPAYTGSFLEGEYLGLDAAGSATALGFGAARLIAKKWQLAFVIGNDVLQDAQTELAQWLMALAGESLANMIDKQGIAGTGAPFVGVLNHPDVAASTNASGHETFAEFSITDASDAVAAVEESVLDGAVWTFHRTVWAKIRVQVDAANHYVLADAGADTLLQVQPRNGGPRPAGAMLSFPVLTSRHLPANSATAVSTLYGLFGNYKALAYGDRGDLRLEQFTSGTFGGKEVALADQRGLVFRHRHALVLTLAGAFTTIKTSAS